MIGAPFDGEGDSSTGSVFVYKETSEDKWELQGAKITPQDGLQGDAFGFSVDVDKDSNLVIGARVRNCGSCNTSQHARLMLISFFLTMKSATVSDSDSSFDNAGAAYLYKIPGKKISYQH